MPDGAIAGPKRDQSKRNDPLIAWRSGAREQFEVEDRPSGATAAGGGRFAAVLEFESFSRIIASMQSMDSRR